MPKNNITEYDSTASNNTDVGGVNLQENSCLPSDMNNAIREVMSHLKDVDSGSQALTALSVTGNITSSADVSGSTLNATGDTSSGDNASIGYTATEGLILTGQGSTNDVTIKNDADADVIEIPTGTTNVTFNGNVLPASDDAQDLGSSSLQWRDIYTGDLNLNNTKTRVNEVDGTSGSWTIQEGKNDLYLLNRLNGKKYKLLIINFRIGVNFK